MSESAISEIEQWTGLVTELEALDTSTYFQVQPFVAADALRPRVSADHVAPLLFQEKVLPILMGEKIATHDTLLTTMYPWLLEFHGRAQNTYPMAFQQFQRDPETLLKVLFAYGNLARFDKAKRTLAIGLRGHMDAWLTRRQKILTGPPPPPGLGLLAGAAPVADTSETTLELYDTLKRVSDDTDLVTKFVSSDLAAVYTQFVAIWSDPGHPLGKEKLVHQGIMAKIRQFTNMLPPASKMEAQDFMTCILTIRTKTLTHLSESKEQYMNARIETLQLEKRGLEDEIRSYRRAISDLGFRHLTEKLPISSRSAGASATARWRNFWGLAWHNSGHGPKIDTPPSPLRALWDKSDPLTRQSIKDTGEKLFGVLSQNIHGFNRAYDPQDAQRDISQGDILKSLQPLAANTTGNDVDWAVECIRWV